MDSLTQAVLGAGISGAMLGRFHGRKALVAGAVLATLPDLDVFIDYGNPVAAMINHRGFSHSLFVLTALAVLLTWALRRWRPSQQYGWSRLFLTLWLVLITHPLLDAFTSYGTQLFWPWRPTPTSWSSIFIIDPLFTLPLVIAVAVGLIAGMGGKARLLCNWALGLCAVYLAASLAIKFVVETRVRNELAQAGAQIDSLFSTPEPFNILLWRVVARASDGHYYEVISSVLDTQPAETIKLPLNTALADAVSDSALLSGLRWFTGDWLRYDEIDGQLIVSDLRMGVGTGYYSFRFRMAERQGLNGKWKAVTPSHWPADRGWDTLGMTLRRIGQQTPALPLAQWELRMK